MKRLLLILTILSLFCFVTAEYEPYDYSNEREPTASTFGNVSITEPVRKPLKYDDWYDRFKPTLVEISEGVCNLSLRAYRGEMRARSELGPVRNYCYVHMNCLMATVSERIKASFAGTSILLGLAPTTLSVLGPSVSEIALLSFQRPLLSLLLSLGAPAIYPGRFLLWEDPLRANEPQTGSFIVPPLPKRWAIAVSVLEYALAGGACANIFQAAYRIGVRSVSSWACETSYWPSIWILMSVVIHLIATFSLRFAISVKKEKEKMSVENANGASSILRIDGGKQTVPATKNVLASLLKKEFTLSSNKDWQVSEYYDIKPGPLAVSLQYLGAFCSVIHLIFGTLLFASLLFIGVNEAVALIVRFIFSAVACRIVLQFEVGGMIKVAESRVYRFVVQAHEKES